MDSSNKNHVDIDPMYERPEYKNTIMGRVADIQKRQIAESMNSKPPKDEAFTGKQLDLFQGFYPQGDISQDDLSNAIELWDALPKYATSSRKMTQMRTKEGFLDIIEHTFIHKGQSYNVKISPALVQDKEGKTKAYYPSSDEELIEEALRKISLENDYGFFERKPYQSGVRFSLSALRSELKKRGHSRSYHQITKSLKILAGSNIGIEAENGKGFAQTNYLPTLAAVSREHYLQDTKSRWFATFHPLVTESIDQISYRQYNYAKSMKLSSPLPRWLLKRLSLNYTNASWDTPYSILLSTIIEDSQMLNFSRKNDVIRKFEEALNELKEINILRLYEKEKRIGKNKKINDIKYILTPSHDFVSEIKAANKRHYDSTVELQEFKDDKPVLSKGKK